MIKEHCFTSKWMESFRERPEYKKLDINLLEKMIYALHLAEQLAFNGLDFVFKGGTSLLILFDNMNRFSIDIDIICKSGREELENVLDNVIKNSRFDYYKLDEHRSYKSGVPKAHYSFFFNSTVPNKFTGSILLDVLFEHPVYPRIAKKPVKTNWIETEGEVLVNMPSIESITGDKLTAFAPHTIGVPYYKGKNSAALEIIKQLYDLGLLFDLIKDLNEVLNSFQRFAEREISYRNNLNYQPALTPEEALKDTIRTCIIIVKRERNKEADLEKFRNLQSGLKALGSGYLTSGKFRIDEAVLSAGKTALLASKILLKDTTGIIPYHPGMEDGSPIENPDWNFLNQFSRMKDKRTYYYWRQSVLLFDHITDLK
ncbi:MAG: nucleotidyl transferase AbiEii/AbiGii toxin family protein [Ignavibacteriaceae bacterium]|nr:nucleotidyl transferase AbiEii/AbiGii toxin family protein [Ignavibacteriaceae bacterium]